MSQGFRKRGVEIVHGFLSAEECDQLLASVDVYRGSHELPIIHRELRGRSLRYFVIDGHRVHDALPQLPDLRRKVEESLGSICGRALEPIADTIAAINVNIVPPGGEYRWHYDRNAVTALVYFNEVSGGETELYANYRLLLGSTDQSAAQRGLDWLLRRPPVMRVFGRRTVFTPKKGSLLVMAGNRTLHSVRRVMGDRDRINAVMAYDAPSTTHTRPALNKYLYTAD
ncbi:MAG: 2OG-Fe(II) oxygenase [Pseudonocardiales bacterium]|nr:2OG-Fe(II) oxygenase [Pseudonocardiales bacterium]MBV9031664.1 2OG-Fe(II) oxygenase [Pseudonocardiales bacterium]